MDAKDFTYASFRVAISRVQQAALDKSNARVPCPADQLALLNSRKPKKDKSTNLGLQYIHVVLICSTTPLGQPGQPDHEKTY